MAVMQQEPVDEHKLGGQSSVAVHWGGSIGIVYGTLVREHVWINTRTLDLTSVGKIVFKEPRLGMTKGRRYVWSRITTCQKIREESWSTICLHGTAIK